MSDKQEKDIVLFNEIKKGNQKAFDKLFNAYYRELCNFSDLMINNKYLAEEIVADVFANIWIKRKKIKINKSVRAYLYRSTRNTTVTYFRKKKHIFDEIEDDILDAGRPEFSPEHNLAEEEIKNKTEKLLSLIPERSREVFVLHRFSGLKYVDIAEMLEISVKTVEKHMSKALKLLRETYRNNLS